MYISLLIQVPHKCYEMESTDKSSSLFSTASLQTLCLSRLITFLEHYPPELLSRLPTTLRHRLFIPSPIIDLCRLEKTCAFDGIDSEKLWGELYVKHWSTFDPGYYDSLIETMVHRKCSTSYGELYESDITNREKYFALMTTTIFCAERPSGFFSEHDRCGGYSCVDWHTSAMVEYPSDAFFSDGDKFGGVYSFAEVPTSAKVNYPTDIINHLVAADKLQEVNKEDVKLLSPENHEQQSDSEYSCDSNAVHYYPVPQRDVHKDNTMNLSLIHI